ncbi:MAG: hypothetical protein UY72_C0013G0031, partial [Candidatus Uhrbacteria bacterium GW2011_GWD2_52_7]
LLTREEWVTGGAKFDVDAFLG